MLPASKPSSFELSSLSFHHLIQELLFHGPKSKWSLKYTSRFFIATAGYSENVGVIFRSDEQ